MTAGSPQICADEFTAALLRRDLAAALALLTPDVTFFYSNGTALLGKEAFASTMEKSWAAVEDYAYSAADATWIAQSDSAAAVIYGFAWSGRVAGAEVSGSGRGTRILRREEDAGWLIAHEHLSTGSRRPS